MLQTEIANLSLSFLGVSNVTITDLATDRHPHANILRTLFPTAKETLLEVHDWSFARKDVALALNASDPDSGYLYEYNYPADCVIVRRIAPYIQGFVTFSHMSQLEQDKYKWEEFYYSGGPKMHTNVEDAWARYTVRIPDAAVFPNYFGRALAAQLAWDAGKSIVTNNWPKVKDMIWKETQNEISKAMSILKEPLQQDSPSPFERARIG